MTLIFGSPKKKMMKKLRPARDGRGRGPAVSLEDQLKLQDAWKKNTHLNGQEFDTIQAQKLDIAVSTAQRVRKKIGKCYQHLEIDHEEKERQIDHEEKERQSRDYLKGRGYTVLKIETY